MFKKWITRLRIAYRKKMREQDRLENIQLITYWIYIDCLENLSNNKTEFSRVKFPEMDAVFKLLSEKHKIEVETKDDPNSSLINIKIVSY